MTIAWSHYKPHYSPDFIMVRRAVFLNFVNAKADIIEENLTPEDVIKLIAQYIGWIIICQTKITTTVLASGYFVYDFCAN